MAGKFTKVELESLELVSEGAPYNGNVYSAIDTSLYDWVFRGEPFVVSDPMATTNTARSYGYILGM